MLNPIAVWSYRTAVNIHGSSVCEYECSILLNLELNLELPHRHSPDISCECAIAELLRSIAVCERECSIAQPRAQPRAIVNYRL